MDFCFPSVKIKLFFRVINSYNSRKYKLYARKIRTVYLRKTGTFKWHFVSQTMERELLFYVVSYIGTYFLEWPNIPFVIIKIYFLNRKKLKKYIFLVYGLFNHTNIYLLN